MASKSSTVEEIHCPVSREATSKVLDRLHVVRLVERREPHIQVTGVCDESTVTQNAVVQRLGEVGSRVPIPGAGR